MNGPLDKPTATSLGAKISTPKGPCRKPRPHGQDRSDGVAPRGLPSSLRAWSMLQVKSLHHFFSLLELRLRDPSPLPLLPKRCDSGVVGRGYHWVGGPGGVQRGVNGLHGPCGKETQATPGCLSIGSMNSPLKL